MKSIFETCALLLITGHRLQLQLQVRQCALVGGVWVVTFWGDDTRKLITCDGTDSGYWLLFDKKLNNKKVRVREIPKPI